MKGTTGSSPARSTRWGAGCIAIVSTVLAIGWTTADDQVDPSAATFFLPIDVPLVSIEVVVTDDTGAPIPGLTKADFEVLEDGEPMEVSHF